MPFSVYLLSLFHNSSQDLPRLCPWTFFLFYFILFPGELATCAAFIVIVKLMTCNSVFPPMLLLLPSRLVSQAGSLTWCLLIILSFQNRTLSTSLLSYHKWQEHYPSCHSDSVTQGYFLLLLSSCFMHPDQDHILHFFIFDSVQIHFFSFDPSVKFLTQTFLPLFLTLTILFFLFLRLFSNLMLPSLKQIVVSEFLLLVCLHFHIPSCFIFSRPLASNLRY